LEKAVSGCKIFKQEEEENAFNLNVELHKYDEEIPSRSTFMQVSMHCTAAQHATPRDVSYRPDDKVYQIMNFQLSL
jgi:hypothetical protein